ncbi:G/U mismatch-specific uracil-DNA glycosylase [Thiogranum longum]|uniref:G/U mismatch-specific uracil-DNA glycosylase n=1 Tax=Thiogranum longum TaxID=1537524 RepID=A0A4R1HAT6_9GAMM|nr:mismatch-specific DNA-glycosylase [Thiogranum longum]TCK17250.1 G/U mismatch-specific uracil-DNA glycosylase [Thiogranum longum]
MKTLPDFVAPGLRILSVGLNPSLPSVEAGFPFANPRNRFWKALNASKLVSAPLKPGVDAMQQLLEGEGIGFTDVVKRPTRGAADLRAADYRQGAPRLLALIESLEPRWAWFHGKLAWQHFLRHADIEGDDEGWGQQSFAIGSSQVFVTPNPSPANAAFSLDDLIAHYNTFAWVLNKS